MDYENENTGGLKRAVQLKFRVTDAERDLIDEKMRLLHTNNLAAYLRKMAIDGYIIAVDNSELKAVAAEMQKIGVNINQIARRVNSTGHFYEQDFDERKRGIEDRWRVLRLSLLKAG
jgi:alpha/beta superfamily hydrolase